MVKTSDYYIWLCNIVDDQYHNNYSSLLKQLYETDFVWLLTMDENRSKGGTNLRGKFSYETSTNIDDIYDGPCTVLEMLIGVADHMEDQIAYEISYWFWVLIENLGLDIFNDSNYDPRGVGYILNTWMNRNYTSNGDGSLFPLKYYNGDCRNLDIWAQMNAWIQENYPTDDTWLH